MLVLIAKTLDTLPPELPAALPWLQFGLGGGILVVMLRIAYMMGGYNKRFESMEQSVAELADKVDAQGGHILRIEASSTALRGVARLVAPSAVRHQVDILLNAANHFDPDHMS